MKKIITILSVLFILTSCGVEKEINNTEKNAVNTVEKITTENIVAGDELIEEKISFSTLEKNLEKLKKSNVSNDELSMFNSQLVSFYNNSIQNDAISKMDASICDKADKNNINNCKKSVFVKEGKIENCDIFTEKYLQNNCKNEIIKKQAREKLDENICEKLVFENIDLIETEENEEIENPEITYCKNSILQEKAIKNLDLSICNKLPTPDKDMCIEIVKMEKENIKIQENLKF